MTRRNTRKKSGNASVWQPCDERRERRPRRLSGTARTTTPTTPTPMRTHMPLLYVSLLFPTCDTNSCSLRKRTKRSWSARRKRRRSRKRRGRRPRLPLLRNRRRNWSLPPAHRSPSPRYHPRRPPNLPESPSTRRPLTTLSVPDPTNFPSPETKKPARSPRSRK